MATIQEINSTIIGGQFTDEQLNSITAAIKFARAQLATKARFTFVKGTEVKFVGRRGETVFGSVEKVNRKFIIVRSGMTNWRVPANMLSAA